MRKILNFIWNIILKIILMLDALFMKLFPKSFPSVREQILKGKDFLVKWFYKGIDYIKESYPKYKQKLLDAHPGLKNIKQHKLYVGAQKYWAKLKAFYHGHKKLVKVCIILFVIFFIGSKIYNMVEMYLKFGTQKVTVVKVEKKTVPEYVQFVGNVESIRTVEIKARVEGFLIERNFVEGSDVNEGELMYVIDPREYQAALDQAVAQLEKDTAALKYADEQVARYAVLVEKDYVSREQFDDIVTQADEAKAMVDADKAAVEKAKLDLSYCTMYAPFNGRVGKTQVDVGNLVGAGGQDTVLATLVQLDPIYVYFSPSEIDYREINKYAQKGALSGELVFPDGTVYPQKGQLNFVDNVVDQATSTVNMRIEMPNPDKALLPGIYGDVRLLLAEKPDSLLIPSIAIAEDQVGSYVFTVNKNNIVELKHIELGEKFGQLKAVSKGLNGDESVIVKGIQFVKTGMKVKPTIVTVDSLNKNNVKDDE